MVAFLFPALTFEFRVYTMQVYNRAIHEIRKPVGWYYPAVIAVGSDVLTGLVNGFLIVFLL
jgi:hypothetical protein